MALGTSNIALSAVRTYLGYTTDWSLFNIGTSSLINKWSRHKPVRGLYPGGSGTFGLNLPTNWNYLQPRGGSPGGIPDEPVRLGDFRQYNHIAKPPIKLAIYPDAEVLNVNSLTFTIELNPDDITITDLSLTGWYFVVSVTLGAVTTWYSAVSTLYYADTNALSITIPGEGDGTYSWACYIAPNEVTMGEEPIGNIALPTFLGYTTTGSSTITLEEPVVYTVNNIPGLAVTFYIDSGLKFNAVCTFTGVAGFYVDGVLQESYLFFGSDVTDESSGISAPIDYGSSKTITVDYV